ncbi:MAG: exodeoxyribonuclease III [Pseudomonadota bacterium]
MKIITANLNGIRSAASKGFFEWMLKQDADVVCLQETKAQIHQLSSELLRPPGYYSYFHDAQKKGYSGVAIYCRREPDRVQSGLGWPDVDAEGRYLQADFGNLSVVSLYLPSGSSGPERQSVKFDVLTRFLAVLQQLRDSDRDYIICGDWNIAHKPIDLKNWRSNQKNSGFLPEERAWLDQVFEQVGWIDAFRAVNDTAEQYTWWSNRGRAREKNVGWRIDYHMVNPRLKEKIISAAIYKEQWFSDHAPLIMEYHGEI